MIEVCEVTKRYGCTLAVDDLSFEVREGEVIGFLGPNGAGKSTTMRMMVGLDAPSSGRITVDGHRYQDLRFPLHHVGALLEAEAIQPGRSARNHPLWLVDSNGISRRRVDHVFDLVGLADVAHRRSGGFSLGMALTADRISVVGKGRLTAEGTPAPRPSRRPSWSSPETHPNTTAVANWPPRVESSSMGRSCSPDATPR